MTHNEALAALDIAVQPVVEAVGVDVPPASPAPGQCWIVGAEPVGAWAGQAGTLAGWTASGWRFLPPGAGWTAWAKDSGLPARHDGSGWTLGVVSAARVEIGGVQVVSDRQAAIDTPDGGAFVDPEARAALTNVINALRAHGLIDP
ncbi:DUF2793 domain-containing protein [Sphingomonas gilva]|uniref:DUF2793 domain-containing protein n=2 Tax=Sphingomonas gilva TaxID=2305907 RepID=A0A396RSC1_9SPHN|nr:DUF2793 domain-containing protein [Sphingomonas gilva]